MLLAVLPLSLILAPGTYEGKDCYAEGIYRFFTPPKRQEQRIVYAGDVFKLLESITWLHLHGFKDTALCDSAKLQAAKVRKLSIACGDIARFTKFVLASQGIESRVVQFETLEARNGYDDGHLMLEVLIDGAWVLVDVDARNVFEHESRRLSASGFMSLHMEEIDIIKFSLAPLLSYNDLSPQGYDYTLYAEQLFVRDDIRIWYKRICQKYYYQ